MSGDGRFLTVRDVLDSPWMSGSCHVHAMACVRLHGGQYAVLEHFGDPWSVGDDGEAVPAIWHVWSVHDTPDGPIARDVTGDRPLSDTGAQALRLWPELEMAFRFGDARVDPCCAQAELECYVDSGDEGDLPLVRIRPEDVNEALALPSVVAPPGVLPDLTSGLDHGPEPQDPCF